MRVTSSTSASSGNGAQPINLIRNAEVLCRKVPTAGSPKINADSSGVDWWATVNTGALAVYAPNQQSFTIADSGPDASPGAVYYDAAESTRRYVVLAAKVSGDGQTSLLASQIEGDQATASTGTLTKESGTGDASIAWTTSGPTLAGYSAEDHIDVNRRQLRWAMTPSASGDGCEQVFELAHEPALYVGAEVYATVGAFIPTDNTVTLAVLDQDDNVIASATNVADGDWETLSCNGTIASGDSSIKWRLTVTAGSPVTVMFDQPTLAVGQAVSIWQPRGLSDWRATGFTANAYSRTGGDVSLQHIDLSDLVPALIVEAQVGILFGEGSSPGTYESLAYFFHAESGQRAFAIYGNGTDAASYTTEQGTIFVSENQILEMTVDEYDANSNVFTALNLHAYRTWRGAA